MVVHREEAPRGCKLRGRAGRAWSGCKGSKTDAAVPDVLSGDDAETDAAAAAAASHPNCPTCKKIARSWRRSEGGEGDADIDDAVRINDGKEEWKTRDEAKTNRTSLLHLLLLHRLRLQVLLHHLPGARCLNRFRRGGRPAESSLDSVDSNRKSLVKTTPEVDGVAVVAAAAAAAVVVVVVVAAVVVGDPRRRLPV